MNLLLLTRQYRKVNYELVDKSKHESRWILPDKDFNRYYYRIHHDAKYDIPKDCHNISLIFSAEKANFVGASLRVRFYKKYNDIISSQTITVPAEVRAKCWEFTRPKMAAYVSVSIRLHTVRDGNIKPNPKTMVLRSQTTTKTINPSAG